MDLKKLLSNYHINIREDTKITEDTKKAMDIESFVSGQVLENEYGNFFVSENSYPLTYIYGGVSFGNLFNIDSSAFSCLIGKNGLDVTKMLFIDTETTGLSSGAGTVAFLIGVGYIKEDKFIVRQYFMRDYNEEAAILYDMAKLIEKSESVVTYNGKSFDMPLMQTRFIANRFRIKTSHLVHIDLLHISRLFWKGYFENCRLSTIETNILGEIRTDDIPGERIPLEYFRYLDTKDASVMKKVLKHNLFDILSLAALLVHFSNMVKNRLKTEDKTELQGLSKLYEKQDDYNSVIECLERRIKLNPDDCNFDVIKRISLYYKRTKQYDKAVEMWNYYFVSANKTQNLSIGAKVFVATELAKYYEHKQKDYMKALNYVDNILDFVCSKSFLGRVYVEELKKRKNRLERLVK